MEIMSSSISSSHKLSIDGYDNCQYISSGGMGIVYKARRICDLTPVAIKVIKGLDDSEHRTELMKRFEREVNLSISFSQPNIVKTFTYGNLKSGEPYVVMELLEGSTLQEHINNFGTVNESEATNILRDICRALAYCHEKGVIHRDIKPNNIFRDKSNKNLLFDFGLAFDADLTRLTETGQALGTFYYMPPEQMTNGKATFASDLYSLGISIYYLMTSQHPFNQDEIIRLYSGCSLKVPLLSHIHPSISLGFSKLVANCMSPSLDTRYSTASEVLQDLKSLHEHKEITLLSQADNTLKKSSLALPTKKQNDQRKKSKSLSSNKRKSVTCDKSKRLKALTLEQSSVTKKQTKTNSQSRKWIVSIFVLTIITILSLTILKIYNSEDLSQSSSTKSINSNSELISNSPKNRTNVAALEENIKTLRKDIIDNLAKNKNYNDNELRESSLICFLNNMECLSTWSRNLMYTFSLLVADTAKA